MLERRRYEIRGLVQGVGFRPFVCRIAASHRVAGWVRNDTRGVDLEIEAAPVVLDGFVAELVSNLPPLARIDALELVESGAVTEPQGGFRIVESGHGGRRDALITPDAHVCADCLRELFDPADRRHRYPFINCTNCGPRFSIIRDLPYDRVQTTMDRFLMCPVCDGEYHDLTDRRFHAQPNACWTCGPRVRLLDARGHLVEAADPIARTVELLAGGAVVAVKGVGGYHIMADPRHRDAIVALRARKRRPDRPLALVSDSLDDIATYAEATPAEEQLLRAVARPIVILRKRLPDPFVDEVAPGQDSYGVMLAYTPLHHLLLRGNFPALVATSANVSNEPIAFLDDDAVVQLGTVVDYFLAHDRPIHTRVDDSIVQSVELAGGPHTVTIRRARGYTPVPIALPGKAVPVLALGAELKSTIAVTKGNQLFVSQHIGDLKNYKNYEFLTGLADHMLHMLEVRPELVACDLHPEMHSTRYAFESGRAPVVQVQHHHAHMASCLLENGLAGPAIGVCFDGAGYGADGTQWGGEFLVGDLCRVERRAHFRPNPLPGGDAAVKQPYRVMLGLLAETFGAGEVAALPIPAVAGHDPAEVAQVLLMLQRGINSPRTSSVGRVFDGVAALLGIRPKATFEGQAAMELEQLGAPVADDRGFDFEVSDSLQIDLRPMIRQIVEAQLERSLAPAAIARRFHTTLALAVRDVCTRLRADTGIDVVVLSGGVFLNRCLLATCHRLLSQAGFRVGCHSAVPTNDGGISVGQAVVASARAAAGLL